MNSPLLVIAAMHYKGILSHDEAEALAALHEFKPDFDHPVPINVGSAMQMVGPVFEGIEEDDLIEAMIESRTAPDSLPEKPTKPLLRWWLTDYIHAYHTWKSL